MTHRLVVNFGRGEIIKYVGHLDLMRSWERTFRRAKLPVAHSQGFNPHPRFSSAAPLPVGLTSQAEIMDLWLDAPMGPAEAMRRVRSQLPLGIELYTITSMADNAPAHAALLQSIEYIATVSGDNVPASISKLLTQDTLHWVEKRGGKTRDLDLRPMIEDIQIALSLDTGANLVMRLRAGVGGTARPQAVIALLGMEAKSIHRIRLLFKE